MNIHLEIQPLLESNKTGVGYYTFEIVKKLLKNKENSYEILNFDFLLRNDNQNILSQILNIENQCKIRTCSLMHYGVYRRIWNYIPVSYNYIMGTNKGIYHFFNFIVPPKVRGPIVNTVYDMVYAVCPETMSKSNYSRLDLELKRSCNMSDAIVTISQNSKREISQYLNINESKIYVASCAVDNKIYNTNINDENIKKLKQRYNLPESFFLYLGTLEPRKNIKTLVKAYKIFNDKYQKENIKLVIAGRKGWMYEEIFEIVKQLRLESDIIFPGYISDEDVPDLYKASLAFVFPSIYEGFGMPPLEAMACGVPVITSNTSSMPEVVGHGGFMSDPYDAGNIAYFMAKLVFDNEVRQEKIKRGIVQADKFSWDESARVVLDIYKNIQ